MKPNDPTPTLTIAAADDFHAHLRGGPMLRAVLPFHARPFRRALVMPNRPWIASADDLLGYRAEILRVRAELDLPGFEPLMTIALEDDTTPRTIEAARLAGAVAAKLYPLGATTGPESGRARGVAAPLAERMHEVYRTLAANRMVLCVHAEMPSPCPRLDREANYLDVVLGITEQHPDLRVVVEHIAGNDAARMVVSGPSSLAATITAHHLVDTIDDVLDSPHHLCNPVPQEEEYGRESLWRLIAAGHPRVFFGSDSAPHPVAAKHCGRPACGVFSAPGLLPRLAGIFEQRGMLDRLEGFVSHRGADFYGLPRNEGTVTLVKRPTMVPTAVVVEEGGVDPFERYKRSNVVVWRGGETLAWSLEEKTDGTA